MSETSKAPLEAATTLVLGGYALVTLILGAGIAEIGFWGGGLLIAGALPLGLGALSFPVGLRFGGCLFVVGGLFVGAGYGLLMAAWVGLSAASVLWGLAIGELVFGGVPVAVGCGLLLRARRYPAG